MKSISSIWVAAIAGVLSIASVAKAQSLCAVTCFQNVVTEHPPLDCTEDSMYLCFCVSPSLQSYFVECAYEECGNGAQDAINFGVSLCADLGEPITIPARPTSTTTTVAESTSDSAVTTTDEASQPDTTSSDDEPAPTTSAEAEPTSETSTTDTQSAPESTVPAGDETTTEETTEPTEVPSESPEDTFVPVPDASSTPIPSGNSTVPPTTEPTHVEPNMGNAMNVPGMAIAAALGMTILRVIF